MNLSEVKPSSNYTLSGSGLRKIFDTGIKIGIFIGIFIGVILEYFLYSHVYWR